VAASFQHARGLAATTKPGPQTPAGSRTGARHVKRPLLLDLYCCAGGAAEGYRRAGFDVVGVDCEPQPHYPFEFVKCDAIRILSLLADDLEPWPGAPWFDAIHASPPCQDHMRGGSHAKHGTGWMLTATRFYLEQQSRPWVIENVPGAPMRPDFKLCGCMFDLALPGMGQLIRERWFETSWNGFEMREPCHHKGPAISVVGHGTTSYAREKLGRCPSIAEYRQLMGIDWTNRGELSQAIPPAYTEHIGRQLLDALPLSATQGDRTA
jgi:DNA (cytosine-5)-methyltransferase 1